MTKHLSPEEILALREKFLLPGTATYYEKPLHIVKGEMQFVYDHTGKRYLDAFSAVVTISAGHCHPDILKKTIAQSAELQHITSLYLTEPVVRAAEKLATIAKDANPKLQKCFFTNSGTEANELMGILAKAYTKSHEFIALYHSFHGRTLFSMGLTGQSTWRHSMPYSYGAKLVPSAYCYQCPLKLDYPACKTACADQVEDAVKYSTAGKIAAFIAEPIQGNGGVIDPPKDYFPKVYDIVKKYGGLYVSDEVQTGFGRTGGKWFGIEQWGVEPDIITMAKGLGNGAPAGGVVTTSEVAEPMRQLSHFSTYGGNPVTTTQVLATIETIEARGYKENAAVVGGYLKEKLVELKVKHPIVGDVRGKGLMLGVEFVKNRETREPAAKETARIMEACKDRGVLVGKGAQAGNVIRIKPPLCVTKDDAGTIVDALDGAIKEATK
jgi:4-aminobutyrate aminotransferase-like enzyme